MYILIALLILSTELNTNNEVEEQICKYLTNIEEGINLSESLWSLTDYMISDLKYSDFIIEKGIKNGYKWTEIISDESDLRTRVHLLSLYFDNEHLHLFLQLQSLTTKERENYFNQFYSNSDKSKLKELSKLIVNDVTITAEDLLLDNWDFSTFLILYNIRNIKINGSNFYTDVYSGLNNTLSNNNEGLSEISYNFKYAAFFESLYQLDRFHLIASLFDKLINLRNLPFTPTKRDLYWGMEFALFRAGHVDRSLEIQRRHTIPLTQQFGDYESLNSILASHGGYLYNLGRFHEAREVFTTALQDSTNLTSTVRTRLLNNLSLVYYKLGESDQYIETQLRALDFAKEQENYSHQLSIYRNLHIYYRKNRNWDLALSFIEEAEEIAESVGDMNELASIIISKAVYYESFLGDIDQAYSLLEDANDILENTTDYRLKVRALYERASLYEQMGRLDQSYAIYEQVLSIGSENNNDAMYLEALVDLADIQLKLDNPEQSRRYIREFNIHDITLVDFFILVNARRIEAEIAMLENRYRDAERIARPIYEQVLQRARNTTDVEAGYWHIEEAYMNLFSLYADLLITQNRTTDLINVLDQLKTINDVALIENPLVTADQLTEEELTENRRISAEIDRLRKQLIAANERDRLSIQNEISSLNSRMNQLSRDQVSEKLFQDLNIWVLQSRLRTGQMVLHMTRINDDFYLLMIDNNGIEHRKLSFSNQQEVMFESAIHGLSTGNTDLNLLHEIYHYLELGEIPPHISSLIVVPDSYLYQLPLGVLPVSAPAGPHNFGSAEYLIENMDVRYVNNLQELLRNEPRERYTYDFTGFGISDFENITTADLISLPKATQEVNAIVEKLDRAKNNRALTESNATPSVFNSSASDSRILHLASHSTISESDPLFSTIYLYPDASSAAEDQTSGQIFAYQLFNMNLRNELVMLNSCESGSGEFFQGAGIMGISRALRYAGARSLILNSWSVQDQFASDFAIGFYTGINEGKSKSEALREAQIKFIATKNANPHYWGSYMLNGDNRPLLSRRGNNTAVAFLMILFAAGFVLTYMKVNGNGKRNGSSI